MPATEVCSTRPEVTASPCIADIDLEIQLPQPLIQSLFQLDSPVTLKARVVGPTGAPVILALGGISANRNTCDSSTLPGHPGWWRDLAGAGRALDTNRFRILSFDFFPDDTLAQAFALQATPADQAHLVNFLCDHLGLEKLYAFVGASYGGMVGLNFAQRFPERLEKLIVACAAHRPHPLGAAWRKIQRDIVRFGLNTNQPDKALSLARELGMTTYRTAEEFGQRFATGTEVADYLESRGRDFLTRMSPRRYLCLSESIDLHAVNPATVETSTTLIAFRQDQLVPIEEVRALRNQLPNVSAYHEFDSIYGHDAFLKEVSLMSNAIHQALSA